MKFHIEIDADLDEPEITVKTPAMTKDIQQLEAMLQKSHQPNTLLLYKNTTEYYLTTNEILFFETSGRQVQAHTISDVYLTHSHLNELEEQLPNNFMRVSKSTILNVNKIFALTKSVSSCLVEFQNTHKQVYVSRRYYKQLKVKLEQWRI